MIIDITLSTIPVRVLSVNDLFVSVPLYSDGSFPGRIAHQNRLLIPLISFGSELSAESGGD